MKSIKEEIKIKIESLEKRRVKALEREGGYNKRLNDLLHLLEQSGELSEKEYTRIGKELKKVMRNRREVKRDSAELNSATDLMKAIHPRIVEPHKWRAYKPEVYAKHWLNNLIDTDYKG